jgi:hypothetical protein
MEDYINKKIQELKNKILENKNFMTQELALKDLFKKFDYDLNDSFESIKEDKHSTIETFVNDKIIDIDQNISLLVHEISKTGIKTTNSCENSVPHGYIWLEFLSEYDLNEFLNIIFLDNDINSEIYKRTFELPYYEQDIWLFNLYLENDIIENKINNINIFPSIRFPRTDHDYVLDKLKKFNLNSVNSQ